MADRESVIEKLQKLIRHEQSARQIGNLAEAEAFAGKVQELLTTHKLEMSEIEFEEREQTEPIDEEICSAREAGIPRTSRRVEWQENLAIGVARNNGCKVLVCNSNTVFFVGRTSDRKACVSLYSYFVKLALELAEIASRENIEEQRHAAAARFPNYWRGQMSSWMKDYRKAFCRGFSDAIWAKLSAGRRELEKQEQVSHGENSTAMVHIRRDVEAIDKYLEDKFKDRKPSKAKDNIDDSGYNSHGYRAGHRAGQRTALTPNILNESRQESLA